MVIKMSREIVLNCIELNNKKIKYSYFVSDDLKRFFSGNEMFALEYTENVEKVPLEIASIPFVCNVLPIVWLTDAVLKVNCLDKNFYECIENIKSGYRKMYPSLFWGGKVEAAEAIEHKHLQKKTAAFFSGGLDATTTLLRHLNEKPDLLTLWGSDISLDDKTGWHNVIKHLENVCKQFELEYFCVRSNFRSFINYEALDTLVRLSGDSYWHGFQHGIGLIGHAAPLAYLNGYKMIYIASSFNEKQKGAYTCASDPMIDNQVKFMETSIVHDSYDLTRQDKARFVVEQSKLRNEKIKLRVCYMESRGENCCQCEKCYRTILEIASEGGEPNDFGFDWNDKRMKRCRWDMKTKITMPETNLYTFYVPIQEAFKNPRGGGIFFN